MSRGLARRPFKVDAFGRATVSEGRRARVRVVDCQWHWHNRSYFEAIAGRAEYPLAEKTDHGYVIRTTPASFNPIEDWYMDVEPQLEHADREGVDVMVSSMGAFNVDYHELDEAKELAIRINE